MSNNILSRRELLRLGAAGVAASWLPSLAHAAAAHPLRQRSCILLWMSGGPSQTDTFDLKPGHANGGPFKEIATSVPGVRIGEHLPRLAREMEHLAIVRSMRTREGDHGRATYHLRTGNMPMGPLEFPTLGALVGKELGQTEDDLPSYVSIGPQQTAPSSGFLGPRYAPLLVDQGGELRVRNLARAAGISGAQAEERLGLLRELEADFLATRDGGATRSHRSAYERAARLMRPAAARAFTLAEEPDRLRDAYGRNRFGEGCLLARRLVERGVPFVEVALGGWDTHDNNFEAVKSLCDVLDPAWATLMRDLRDRGLLERTVVVWMGEFGRTPAINSRLGRDHYPAAWSVVLGGGGIRSGGVLGRTGADGLRVTDRPVAVPDLLATVCLALGIDPEKQNMSNVGRPIRIVDKTARPIHEVLA